MKQTFLLFTISIFFFGIAEKGFSAIFYTVASGSWGTASKWSNTSCGGPQDASTAPSTGGADQVTICSGYTITATTLTINNAGSITVESGGQLNVTTLTLTNTSFVLTVNNGGTLKVGTFTNTTGNNHVLINGLMNVTNTFDNNATISGSGNIYFSNSGVHVGNTGTVFGETGNLCNPTPCYALPVELINFTAQINSRQVDLKWSTASEKNNDFFTIERSENGKLFETVNTIDGAGNSSTIRNYESVDAEPISGLSYYRLKQTDLNGLFSYSNIISIYLNGTDGLSVFPSPSSGNINVSVSGGKGKKVLLIIRNVLGSELYSKEILPDSDNSVQPLELSGLLAPGVYMISASSEDKMLEKKIVIR